MVYRTFGMVHRFSILDFLSVTDLLIKVFCPFPVPPEGEGAGLGRHFRPFVRTLARFKGTAIEHFELCVMCRLEKDEKYKFFTACPLAYPQPSNLTDSDRPVSKPNNLTGRTAPRLYRLVVGAISPIFATSAIWISRLTTIPY